VIDSTVFSPDKLEKATKDSIERPVSPFATAQAVPAPSVPVPVLPTPPRPTPPEPTQPAPLPPPEELLPLPGPGVSPPEATPGGEDFRITVQRFEVIGSTVFSPEELEKATSPFIGRPVSLSELLQARSAITQLYVDAGYITSGAFLPPQKFEAGVVRIQVVEGSLESINVTGTRRLNPKYVRDRIALATTPPLNVRRLLEALQLLQLNPLIRNLSAELAAGTRPGSNLLEVTVAEAKTFSLPITLDNGRSPSVGSFRRRVQLNEANLLGQGDGLSLGYTNTDGSNSVELSYTYPINPRNGTLSFRYSNTLSRVIEEPFDLLEIRAPSEEFALTLRQPLIQSPTQEFALGLTADHRRSETSIAPLGIPRIGFPLSPGADAEGKTRVSALRFFQEWTQRSSQQVFALRSQFNVGINALGANINDSAPDGRFFSWRGQGQWVRLLAPDTLLILRTDIQFADRPLVPLEQFSLGGLENLRGYRQDALLADSGILASAELRFPIYRNPRSQHTIHLIPFIDVGRVWNTADREDPDPGTLSSVGIGLQWQWSDRLRARLDYGIPLVSIPQSDNRSLQERGLYFSIILNPF
jgi:hemolysin activation/secretion protein